MKNKILFVIVITLIGSCNYDTAMYRSAPLGIEKICTSIRLDLAINAVSKDSIITTVTFINTTDTPFVLYKPLLPYQDFTENNFGVLEIQNTDAVEFLVKRKEHYLEDDHLSEDTHRKSLPLNVIPVITPDNLVEIYPKDSLVVTCNIAPKFDFKSYLLKGYHEFKISFGIVNPLIIDGKQEFGIDSLSKIRKPVYNYIFHGDFYDYDSQLLKFKIPE